MSLEAMYEGNWCKKHPTAPMVGEPLRCCLCRIEELEDALSKVITLNQHMEYTEIEMQKRVEELETLIDRAITAWDTVSSLRPYQERMYDVIADMRKAREGK